MSTVREKRLVEDLQADLRLLSNETKRKYPPVKEAAESAIMIIRTVLPFKNETASIDIVESLRNSCRDILQPFIMGCDTRSIHVVQLCLNAIQRIVTHEIADAIAAKNIVCVLWQIFEQGIDDLQLRLLQTVIVLVTSKSCALTGQSLAKAIVLCFRLHFTKSYVVNNTAEATIRQIVALVFDRLMDPKASNKGVGQASDCFVPKTGSGKFEPPSGLSPQREDAYYLFQDLCQLVISDNPHWLVGITEMTVSFGLELIENVLVEYGCVFKMYPELKFLLKDRVCALIIRLFSPNIQNRQGAPPLPSGASPSKDNKPLFPLSMRLLRLVCLLLKQYYSDLITESEIFLSLLVKFLESNKPAWQCVLAIEVLSQLCAHPGLMKSFCMAYDMQTHSTKIFRNLVLALCTFIQSLFIHPNRYSSQISAGDSNLSSSGAQVQFIFHQRGVNFPMPSMFSPTSSCIRYVYCEMLDKSEPPVAPEGYMLAVAYVSLLDLIKVLTENYSIDLPTKTEDENEKKVFNLSKTDENIVREMIGSSWESLYSVLSLLLNTCNDETCTSSILKSIGTIAGICGHLKLNAPRDAFIIILCKAALPVKYALPILQNSLPRLAEHVDAEQSNFIEQQQVVVVGQQLPSNSSNLPPALCSVSLTAKNVQCMLSILEFSNIQGANVNTAWQYILATLQHLVWILGLQPSAGGILKPNKRSSSESGTTNSSVLTTAILSELPILSNMLSKLFEASKSLDDVALHHLINALCSLSVEAMDTAYNTAMKEPSLFAVAKLLETGLVNMDRIEILWRPVTGHLLEVCQHPNNSLREWGAEGVVSLVKAAMKLYSGEKIQKNPRLLHMFLLPFRELSSIEQQDVRIKQLDGVLQVLNTCGDNLGEGWNTVLLIIGSATNIDSASLVRLGFKSVQLVISEYLLALPVGALPCCIDVVEQYAKQTQDFNISLTAIGLLWSMSDYIHQNENKIQAEVTKATESVILGPSKLWMYLFGKMGTLCMDGRPAIRKSAGQTLFSTLSAHWSNLSPHTLSQVMWEVLFPLMDNVQKACNNASTEKNYSAEQNIMVHHSRDTEEKQWQETSVLTLAGISRVFKAKHLILLQMKNFEAALNKILDYIQTAATSNSIELSRSSLCSFEEILNPLESLENNTFEFWRKYWKAWCNIGIKITIPPPPGQITPDEMLSQAYLTSLVQLFPHLHIKLADKFDAIDFKHLAQVLYGTVCIPVRSDTTAFVLPSALSILTPLQEAVVNAVDVVQKSVSSNSDSSMYPAVFEFLLSIVDFATVPPTYGDIKNHNGPPDKTKWVCVNYVSFAEYCMQVVVSLFQITSCHKAVINKGILTSIIRTFRGPLTKKFVKGSTKTWQLAVNSLLKILNAGLPVVRQHSQQHLFDNLWDELAGCMEDYLFPGTAFPSNTSVEEHDKLETYDVHLIELIRSEILPYRTCFPKYFLDKVVTVLNKGSVRTTTKDMDMTVVNGERARERLNKECFDTLFQFSISPLSNGGGGGSVNDTLSSSEEMTEINEGNIVSLLQRCRSSLTEYVSKSRMQTHFPMSELHLNDVLFSVKSVTTLFTRLNTTKLEVSDALWCHLFDLYPTLVECIPTSSSDVRAAVALLMGLYKPFLSHRHLSK